MIKDLGGTMVHYEPPDLLIGDHMGIVVTPVAPIIKEAHEVRQRGIVMVGVLGLLAQVSRMVADKGYSVTTRDELRQPEILIPIMAPPRIDYEAYAPKPTCPPNVWGVQKKRKNKRKKR
jgi:hypothetical protein